LPVRLALLAALVVGGAAFFGAFCQLTGTVDFRRSSAGAAAGCDASPLIGLRRSFRSAITRRHQERTP
jgi:hypothetical protein